MKIKPWLLALVPLFGSCAQNVSSEVNSSIEDEINNKVQIVVMLGQSNMEGHTFSQYLLNSVGQEKMKEYIAGYGNVLISYECLYSQNSSNGQFVPVKLGQGNTPNHFGPEVGMAEVLSSSDIQDKVYFIKFTQGGTTLSSQWRSPSSRATGQLYSEAVKYIHKQIEALENMGLYPEISAFCWMQGESDASGNGYASYYEYEKALIKDLRQEFLYYSNPNGIGFIDAYISDAEQWTHYQEINDAKQRIAKEDDLNVVIDTISENLEYGNEPPGSVDTNHYDSASMIKLGNLFAQKLLEGFIK